MSKLVKAIEIEGKPAVTLFTTEVERCFVRRDLLPEAAIQAVCRPYRVGVGEKRIEIKEIGFMQGRIDGLGFHVLAEVVDSLDPADGQRLDAIIGLFEMKRWEIRIFPKSGRLSLAGLRRRTFTEFSAFLAHAAG